jgi:hypothetical protein
MVLEIGGTGEDELIASQSTAASHQTPEFKLPVAIKAKNFLRFGYLEWITTDPIDHI